MRILRQGSHVGELNADRSNHPYGIVEDTLRRAAGILYPVVTFFAITITGNHYILDAVAGGGLAGVSFGLMELASRRRRLWPGIGSSLGRLTGR